jgi:hypothetical protein
MLFHKKLHIMVKLECEIFHCWYPVDRAPPRIGMKSRQGARHATTCLTGPDPASPLRRALTLLCVLWLWTQSPRPGGL